jgi:hypothetical protein
MDCVTRETAGRGAQQERGGRSGCRGRGALGGDRAAMAVLARDVALEPALLPDKGRTHTAQAAGTGREQKKKKKKK